MTETFRILSLLLCLLIAGPTGYAQVLEGQPTQGGSLAVHYKYGLDLIHPDRSGTVRYYDYDGQGSVRYLTAAANPPVVSDTYTYGAYAILLLANGSTANHYRYTGEQWDADLGLYYLRARYYHPDVGRFWTMDTFERTPPDPLSPHKYLYCHADPVNRIDPSGMMDMIQLQATMTKISGLAAYTGFRAVLVLNRVTVIVFEAVTGNTVIVGGAGAVVALKQGTKMGGVSWPTWQSIGNLLKGSGNKVGTYKEVAKVLERGSGQQANHLNQAKAFTNIPYDEGVAAAMGGGTNLKGTQHWRFHDVLEAFWRPFRASGTKPTNAQYAKAMEEGLEAAGYASEEVRALSKLAEESRVSFGYHDGPGGLLPEVPGAIPGM